MAGLGRGDAIILQTRTVHRILDRYALIELQDRRQRALKRFERSEPNELWQMDFKGPQSGGASAVGPLSVIDDRSRYLLALRHLGSTRLEGVRSTLTDLFQPVGMPDSMLMDHGGRRWEISNGLRRQVVGIESIADRAIVYFCRTPIRELNLQTGTATPIIGSPIRFLQC